MIVSEQPISGQSGDLMQHEHWTLPAIPAGVTIPAQIQALVTGVSGANGNLALGLGHEMVSTLLWSPATCMQQQQLSMHETLALAVAGPQGDKMCSM